MTIAERIDALEKELAGLKEQLKTDVVADYRNGGGRTSYAVSFDNVIIPCPLCNDYPNNTYCYHHTKEYAKMAMEMKEFNDKLLAFKWCYDRYAVYEVKFEMFERHSHDEFVRSYVLTGACGSDVISRAMRKFSKDINENVELTKEFLISTDSLTGTLSVVKKQNI